MSPRHSTRNKVRRRRKSRRIRKARGGSTASDKAMIIVEPREHRNLKRVLQNFHDIMDKSWDLYVFHGKSKGEFARSATEGLTGRTVNLIPLDADNLSHDEYNTLFLNPDFWNKVNAENILVFQTDAALCKKFNGNIDKFMKYDYIGCSYNKDQIGNGPWPKYKFYGVGGLSLRKKSFMLKCIASAPAGEPEDAIFGNCVDKLPTKPESGEVLSEFCTQNEFYKNKPSFGAHKTDLYLETPRIEFNEYCPEAIGLDEHP